MRDMAACVDGKHAGRNAFENSLNMPSALLESNVGSAKLAAGAFDLAAAGLQLLGHAVERTHQVADFIGCTHIDAIVKTAARNLLRRFGERHHRPRDQLGEK